MQKIYSSFMRAKYIILILLVVFVPLVFASSELLHTVQAVSFTSEADAVNFYESIEQKLQGNELDYLRIEKIGAFYAVRVGKFETNAEAKELLKAVIPHADSAAVIKAYIKDDRVVRMHSGVVAINEQPDKEKALPEAAAEKVVPAPAKKTMPEPAEKVVPAAAAKAEATNESSASAHQSKGDKYWEIDRNFLAIEEYRQAIKLGLKHPDLYWKLAKILYITGFLGDAVNEMEQAVALKPDLDVFRIELGILYLADKQLGKAKQQFISALTMNPSLTQVYIYLSELSYSTKDYDAAWYSLKVAQSLGYSGKDIYKKLSAVSEEPTLKPWDKSGENFYIRQILVDSREKAENILKRIANEELFELIAGVESIGPNALKGGFIGSVHPSKLDPRIVNAIKDGEIFSEPVIVETDNGFHIIQHIAPFNYASIKNFLIYPAASNSK